MPDTFIKIASQTLTSSSGSITFSSIPATYTDLKLLISTRIDSATVGVAQYMRFNSSTSSYSYRSLSGDGSTANSNNGSSLTEMPLPFTNTSGTTANTFASTEIYIPNYLSSNQKSVSSDGVSENNGTTAFTSLWAGLWTGTAAITSITLFYGSINFVSGSTFTLYGIKNS